MHPKASNRKWCEPRWSVSRARVPNHFIREDYVAIDWHLPSYNHKPIFTPIEMVAMVNTADSSPVTLVGLQVEAGTLRPIGFLSQTSSTQGGFLEEVSKSWPVTRGETKSERWKKPSSHQQQGGIEWNKLHFSKMKRPLRICHLSQN